MSLHDIYPLVQLGLSAVTAALLAVSGLRVASTRAFVPSKAVRNISFLAVGISLLAVVGPILTLTGNGDLRDIVLLFARLGLLHLAIYITLLSNGKEHIG